MRILLHPYVLVPILLLSPITVLAHQTSRRTVNFVPPHPGAEFHTEALPIFYSRDPYRVAQAFLDKLGYPNGSYFIRKDSYTDENTGISHVYVRQVVNDLEVADANININIRDGQILSYGNSFFKGSENSSILPVPNWHQTVYCSEASMRPNDPACGSALDRVQAIASLHALDESGYHHDPRAAAFFFLQVAHPDPASLPSAFASLKAKYHECGNLLEQRASCDSWLVTGYSDKVEPIHVRQVYVQTPGTSESTDLNLAWRLETSLPENYYVAYVSVHDPSKIISMFDQVLDAPTLAGDGWLNALERYIFSQFQEALPSLGSMPYNHNTAPTGGKGADSPFPKAGTYHVWKWGINDPDSGNRTLEVPPIDRRASPLGWHSVPAGKDPLRTHPNLDKETIVNYTSTVGNNIIAQENWAASSHEGWKTNNRPDGGPNLIFDFPQPYAKDPHEDPRQFSNNSITQLFYAANMYHDLLYLYGFDEISGNYQQYNFGKGGAEGDAIIIDAQIGQKYNNAFFTVTRDGQNGRCHMYLWDMSRPLRDGALDQGILIHELSHGLSSRLTGGRNNTECLRTNAKLGPWAKGGEISLQPS
ncbi:hypothetical protein OPQ81_008177 [Rhizoctonia solani]|nr:hypothetical protein OPQ81_008177 [Rhizoctonia solani]